MCSKAEARWARRRVVVEGAEVAGLRLRVAGVGVDGVDVDVGVGSGPALSAREDERVLTMAKGVG